VSFLDRVQERVQGRAFPAADLSYGFERELGHRDEFGPAEYGDYIATSNDVFWAATRRARAISSVPLRAYRGSDSNKVEVTSGRVVDLLHKVNPHWTFKRLMHMTELSMCLWGEGFWAVEYGGPGRRQPREMWWLKSPNVHPIPDESKYLAGFLYEPGAGMEPIRFEPNEILWFRYPNPLDEFAGLSPLAAARLAADTGSSMMRSNKAMFDNGMHLAGIVSPDDDRVTFTKEQAEALEGDLARRFKGADKHHKWAVLRYQAKFNQMQVSPKDAEWVNGLNLSFRQVCRAYGLQSALGNDLEHATLANAQVFERLDWEHTFKSALGDYATDLEEQFLPLFRVGRTPAAGEPDHLEFDLSGVSALQESETATWEREGAQIERGALTINEWRKKHGYAPVDWGDVYWAPVNKAPVTSGEDNPADNPDVPNDTGVPANQQAQDAADRTLLLAAAIAKGQTDQIDRLVEELRAPRQREVIRDEHGRIVRQIERVTDGAR
jgi:HK97 family phage portal protein